MSSVSLLSLGFFSAALLPKSLALAEELPRTPPRTLAEFVGNVISDVNVLIWLITILAGVWVSFIAFNYLTAGGNEEKLRQGRKYLLIGLLVVFLMISFWGLANLFVCSLFSLPGHC